MITLHGNPLSGNSHRVTAMLALLGLEYENVIVNLKGGAHKAPEFLSMNPLGQIPVLTDGDLILRDSIAILIYLSEKYDTEHRWLPADPAGRAKVQQWLSTALIDIQTGPFLLRVNKVFGSPIDRDGVVAKTQNLFGNLFEPHLTINTWLVGDTPTLADVACYGYIARVTEGDFSLEPYPGIRRWLARIEAIEGFLPMGHAAEILKSA